MIKKDKPYQDTVMIQLIKKAECQRDDAFELWCWRTLESLGQQGDPTSPP